MSVFSLHGYLAGSALYSIGRTLAQANGAHLHRTPTRDDPRDAVPLLLTQKALVLAMSVAVGPYLLPVFAYNDLCTLERRWLHAPPSPPPRDAKKVYWSVMSVVMDGPQSGV